MRSSAAAARKCFEDIRDRYGSPATDSEKFNLYNGLLNLVNATDELGEKVYAILRELRQLTESH